ncbi:MAG: YkgJ family cysteine cluster protein [Planctomycetota bacterium]
MTSKKQSEKEGALNGLSVNTLTLSQDGELEIEFDLPSQQTTDHYYTRTTGTRTLDVYDDPELEAACRNLFSVLKRKMEVPDAEKAAVDCESCATSSCCRKYNVLLRDSDIDRLSEHLEIARDDVIARYTDKAVDWAGDFERQLRADEDPDSIIEDEDEKCVFLLPNDQGIWRCSIYEARPQICRDFDMKSCSDFVSIEDVTRV